MNIPDVLRARPSSDMAIKQGMGMNVYGILPIICIPFLDGLRKALEATSSSCDGPNSIQGVPSDTVIVFRDRHYN